MIEVETAAYLEWWYKVAKARISFNSLSEFLKSATRKYMERNSYLDDVTDDEHRERDRMREEAGIPTLDAFTLEIKKILKGIP